MAEEAVGLAKSLGWHIEFGPNFVGRNNEDEADAVDSGYYLKRPGRKLGINKHTVEGEELKNGDKVYAYGTGLHGYYIDGLMHIDVENYTSDTESDEEELNEWTDASLRQNIAVSGLIRVRRQGAPGFFGKGKVKHT